MFVYQNKEGAVCITFQDNKPVENPEYVLVVDKEAGTLTVNGTEISVAANDVAEASVEEEETISEAVSDEDVVEEIEE